MGRGSAVCSVHATLTLMATEVRTPFSVSAVELSGGGLYRKQVLKFGTINYTDSFGKQRKITFDRKYGEDLIRAFKEGAYPQVPFQLADANNRHTNDPTRTGGEVVGVELSRDGSGLDAFLRTWGEGARVVEQNPKLGVSARILENTPQPDGRTFPRALQHVLGTVDPQVRDMHPWEKVSSVEFSSGSAPEALDLSNATYERSANMPEKDDKGGDGTVTLELSTAQAERLKSLLDEDEAIEALAAQLDELGMLPGDEDEEEPETDEAPVTELSGPVAEAIELANATAAQANAQVIELTNRLNEQRTATEVAEYQREGLAPAVLECARPLLTVQPGAVELSNGVAGQAIDPAEVMRETLATVIELAKSGHLLVDPDDERGSLKGDTGKDSERAALLADWENYG